MPSGYRLLQNQITRLRTKTVDEILTLWGPWTHLTEILGTPKRMRLFPPSQTFWLFLSQVLEADHSCRTVVRKFLLWLTLKTGKNASPNTASFCKARARLPQKGLESIHRRLTHEIEAQTTDDLLWRQRRVKIVDGTGLSMPDTRANQKIYPQSKRQKPGCGFPVMKLVAAFSLATGTIIGFVKGTLHDAERILFKNLWGLFEPGDVVLADSAFCSYADFYFLSQRRVDCVMANHHRRTKGLEFVKSLGKEDRLLYWIKMKPCPTWLEKRQWEKVPEKLLIREVSFSVTVRGFKTKRITLATTLLDQRQYPKEDLAQLYRRRWIAELYLRDIKITMGMDILRCKTPDMVHKELIMYIIAYNLMRALLLQSCIMMQVQMDRLSFKGALAILRQANPSMLLLIRTRKIEKSLHKAVLFIIAKDIVPDRPNRQEPRARKRRPKNYQLLNKPRSQFREIPHRNKYSKPLN